GGRASLAGSVWCSWCSGVWAPVRGLRRGLGGGHSVALGGPGCRAVPGGSIKTGGRPVVMEEARHRSELALACTSRPDGERKLGVGWPGSCGLGQLVVGIVGVRLAFAASDVGVP